MTAGLPAELSTGAGPLKDRSSSLPLVALATVRLMILISLPFEALVGYGDYQHFYNLAHFAHTGGGLPFLSHWIEFPPLFPFLSILIYRLASGRLQTYVYLLAMLMAAFDLASLWIFTSLSRRLLPRSWGERAVWLFMVFLAVPALGWWTFEPMAVFWSLATLWLVLERAPVGAGLAAGLGVLTKWFPALPLVVAWRFRERRQALLATAIAGAIVVAAFVPLWISAPDMTRASLLSQWNKASWETVWALIDGNYGTGSLGPMENRLDPSVVLVAGGASTRVPMWITTILGGVAAYWFFRREDRRRERRAVPFLALAWSILLLWSRGWSPQWVAYLIPLLFLSLSPVLALGFSIDLAVIALLEWPVLLTRGRFDLLWVPVVLRTLVLLMLVAKLGRLRILPARPRLAKG